MGAVVLALAGLVCGDGGPGPAAAREPAALDLGAVEWEGTARLGLSEVCEARYAGGRLTLSWPAERKWVHSPFELTPAGGGRARLSISGRPFPALLHFDGRRLLVCYGDGKHGPPRSFEPDAGTVLLTLRPAGPRQR
jgi:hypothetical protein